MSRDTSRPLITVTTRLSTINIGNEALSGELLALAAQALPDLRVHALERAPHFLARYSAKDLPRNIDRALALFDSWTEQIEERFRRAAQTHRLVQPIGRPRLLMEPAHAPWKGHLKTILQLRRIGARIGLYDAPFLSRVTAHRSAALAILNPAGEFNPRSIDPPLRMLLELNLAAKLGARTGVVNFSFETPSGFYADLFAAILSRFDFLAVRDHRSRLALESLGLRQGSVAVIGDLAFLTEPDASSGHEIARRLSVHSSSIALVMNGRFDATTLPEWVSLADQLRTHAADIVVLSNELSSDLPFIRALQARTRVRVVEEQFSYREYAALLAHFRLVVSSRLHTAVLALVSGTPVVAVELIQRRIKGVMEEIQYPLEVPLMSEPGWVQRTLSIVSEALAGEQALRARIPPLIATRRTAIRDSMRALLGRPPPNDSKVNPSTVEL